MDLDPEARRILSLAREARTPSPEDKARVERRLAMSIGAGVLATTATATTVAAGQAAQGVLVGKVVTLGALKWWLGGSAVLIAALGGAAVVATPTPKENRPAEERVVAVAEEAREDPEAPAPETGEVTEPAQAEPAAERAVAPKRKPSRARGDSLQKELALLHRAHAAWRNGEPQAALKLVREHKRRYPTSNLELERDALEVLSLCELGKSDRAARIARDLLTRAPNTPLRASIEESCALR